MHLPVGKKAVETAGVASAEGTGEPTGRDPAVDIPAGQVHDLLNLGQELRAAAVTQARRDERRRLDAGTACRAQEADWVVLDERLRFIFGGEASKAGTCCGRDGNGCMHAISLKVAY